MIVIDSSALVELVLDPELAQRSGHLLGEDVFAPALLIPESLNALKKQVSRKLLSPQRAAVAMRRIHTAPIDMVSMHNLTEHIWQLSGTFSTYDACYVALAQHLDTALFTCDIKLANEARRHISVLVPE
jgi:predicted nucleic acid-binding protein